MIKNSSLYGSCILPLTDRMKKLESHTTAHFFRHQGHYVCYTAKKLLHILKKQTRSLFV